MTLQQRIKFFFQGKPYLKIITVLLSAAAFALCSIGSMGYTNSVEKFWTDVIYNQENIVYMGRDVGGLPGLTISYCHNADEFGDHNVLSQSVMDIIEQGTSCSYLYGYAQLQWGGVYNSFGNRGVYTEMHGKSELEEMIVVGSIETMEEWGFSLLAGSYPVEADEIALSEAYFEGYKTAGYVDVTECYNNQYSQYDSSAAKPVEEINDYSDIIGKKIVVLGDPENGKLFDYGTSVSNINLTAQIYKIVGVVETSSGCPDLDNTNYKYAWRYPGNKLYVSEAWRELYFKRDGVLNDTQCQYMYTPQPTSYEAAAEIARACIKATDLVRSVSSDIGAWGSFGVGPDNLIDVVGYGLYASNYIRSFAVIGAAMAVIAVALQIFSAYNSFNGRRKQIGILQSMGAGKKQLLNVFTVEALFMSIVCLIIGAPFTFGLYNAVVAPAIYVSYFSVYYTTYGWINFVIFVAMALIIPLLATLICSARLLKYSPVENIRKETKGNKNDRGQKRRGRD